MRRAQYIKLSNRETKTNSWFWYFWLIEAKMFPFLTFKNKK